MTKESSNVPSNLSALATFYSTLAAQTFSIEQSAIDNFIRSSPVGDFGNVIPTFDWSESFKNIGKGIGLQLKDIRVPGWSDETFKELLQTVASLKTSARRELVSREHPMCLNSYASSAIRAYDSEDWLGASMPLFAFIEGYITQTTKKARDQRDGKNLFTPQGPSKGTVLNKLKNELAALNDEDGKTLLEDIIRKHWPKDNFNGQPESRDVTMHGALESLPTQELVDDLIFFANSLARLYERFSVDSSTHISYSDLSKQEVKAIHAEADEAYAEYLSAKKNIQSTSS